MFAYEKRHAYKSERHEEGDVACVHNESKWQTAVYAKRYSCVHENSDEDIVSACINTGIEHEVQTCTNGVTTGELSRGFAR